MDGWILYWPSCFFNPWLPSDKSHPQLVCVHTDETSSWCNNGWVKLCLNTHLSLHLLTPYLLRRLFVSDRDSVPICCFSLKLFAFITFKTVKFPLLNITVNELKKNEASYLLSSEGPMAFSENPRLKTKLLHVIVTFKTDLLAKAWDGGGWEEGSSEGCSEKVLHATHESSWLFQSNHPPGKTRSAF